jgi:sugar lactone lactonase YvrE
MKKTIHTPIEKTKPKAIWGVLAAVLIAIPLPAQYVNTLISTNLSQPWGVAAVTNGNVYLTDSSSDRIVQYSVSGGTSTALATIPSSHLLGIVAARDGLVVVDQANQVIRFVSYSGAVSTLAGSIGNIGTNDGADATFSFPVGITADASGNLYVADWGNALIREIDTNNNVTTVPAGGYQFVGPKAVAVDNAGNLWVADTDNQVICMVSNGVATVEAGTPGQTGTADFPPAASAQFNAPSGLLWDSVGNRLLISDSGNATIRSLFLTNINGSNVYAVQTIAGSANQEGLVDGLPSVARFAYPVGLAVDAVDSGFYIVDSGNNALRVLQPSAPQPPISAPVIGYVIYPATANPPYSSVFVPTVGGTFNNSLSLVIEQDGGPLSGVTTYYTFGSPSLLGTNSQAATVYPGDGYSSLIIGPSIINFPNSYDVTLYAVSEESGRQPSAVTNAHFLFITANPQIIGDNAANVQLTDATDNALIYYTIDGTTPTNDGSSGVGVSSGVTLPALNITNTVTLQARAFAAGFAPSGVVNQVLSVSNFIGNQVSWGFASGPASTHFITAANLLFTAPVTFTQLAGSLHEIYAMQFDLTVTNNGPTPPPVPTFVSDLLQPVPGVPNAYLPINPAIFLNGVTNPGVFGTQVDTLAIGWLVTPPVTNLYTSTELLQYSGAAQRLFDLDTDGGVAVLGEAQFVIPAAAPPGTPYTLEVNFPSASSYDAPLCCGPPINVLVQTTTNGPMTGTGPNAAKLITVLSNNSPASAHLVGDVFPFTWHNIGDFGDYTLLDDDVIETMEWAGTSKFANNPFFDAMDSNSGSTNNYYTASDSIIDTISTGDGQINVDDVYVTFRRSSDSSLVNYTRYWSGSNWVPTVYSNVVQLSAKSSASPPAPVKLALSGPRYITVAADQVQTGGNPSAQVPIRVLAGDPLPVRVFMLNVDIQPLDGSPAITSTATFTPSTNLGAANFNVSQGVNNYAAAWLDSTVAGVTGTNIIGTLSVTLPSNVTGNSAYRVHFNHFSASPNGIALFHTTIRDGLITVGDRTGSSWNDGIPDTWRLLYFGTVSNALSAANADPDGDGASNWEEYVAGTNPLDATSVFKFQPATPVSSGAFTLQWPSVVNRSYSLQSSPSMSAGWTTITNLIGNGQTLQWTDTNSASGAKFYRALVQ